MKSGSGCPKCASKDVIRIHGRIGGHGAGNNITTGWTIFSSVKVTRYLCGRCGFSEEWVEGKEAIAKVRAKYGGS